MIRKATIQDGANIAAISIQVWLDTYAHHGIRPVLSRYVLSEYSEERVRGRIESEEQIFLLYEEKNHLLGFAAVDLNAVCPPRGRLFRSWFNSTYRNGPPAKVSAPGS